MAGGVRIDEVETAEPFEGGDTHSSPIESAGEHVISEHLHFRWVIDTDTFLRICPIISMARSLRRESLAQLLRL